MCLYARDLCEAEGRLVQCEVRHGRDAVYVKRCQVNLASAQGMRVDEIAKLTLLSEYNIRELIRSFSQGGLLASSTRSVRVETRPSRMRNAPPSLSSLGYRLTCSGTRSRRGASGRALARLRYKIARANTPSYDSHPDGSNLAPHSEGFVIHYDMEYQREYELVDNFLAVSMNPLSLSRSFRPRETFEPSTPEFTSTA